MTRLAAWLLAGAVAAAPGLTGCGGASRPIDYGVGLGERPDRTGTGALKVRWHRPLTPVKRGAYVPVETSVAAIDEDTGRLYVPSAGGSLYAFQSDGTLIYRFEMDTPLESEPALDGPNDELYFGSERGDFYSLVASTGEIRWRTDATGTIRRKPVLTQDAVYVITESDVVEAFSRENGSLLWRVEREPLEGFLVAGHAGLTLVDGRIYTAFNDGAVMCLDAVDGRVRWKMETSIDAPEVEPGLPRYLDVDTTPILANDMVYVASFAAGLYALDAGNGSVAWRLPEWTGVVGLAEGPSGLIVSSADRGVAHLDVVSQEVLWHHAPKRGTAGPPMRVRNMVLFGESHGSLLALDARTGKELSRIDAGFGFEALPNIRGGYGYVVTNGGTLLALSVAR